MLFDGGGGGGGSISWGSSCWCFVRVGDFIEEEREVRESGRSRVTEYRFEMCFVKESVVGGDGVGDGGGLGVSKRGEIGNNRVCSFFVVVVVVVGSRGGENNNSGGDIRVNTHTTNGGNLSFFKRRKERGISEGFSRGGGRVGVKEVERVKRGGEKDSILGGEFDRVGGGGKEKRERKKWKRSWNLFESNK